MYSFIYWICFDSLASFIYIQLKEISEKVYNELIKLNGLQSRFSDKPLMDKKGFPSSHLLSTVLSILQ